MSRKPKSIALLIGHYHEIAPVEFDLLEFDDDQQTVIVHFHGDDYIINNTSQPIMRELTWNYFRMLMSKKVCPGWFAKLMKE